MLHVAGMITDFACILGDLQAAGVMDAQLLLVERALLVNSRRDTNELLEKRLSRHVV